MWILNAPSAAATAALALSTSLQHEASKAGRLVDVDACRSSSSSYGMRLVPHQGRHSRPSTAESKSFVITVAASFGPRSASASTRLFSSRKGRAPAPQNDNVLDEDETDLYLVAAASSSTETSTMTASSSNEEAAPALSFATSYHAPVMWKECIEALTKTARSKPLASNDNDASDSMIAEQRKPRLFVDGTLGGGGHSQALLEALTVGDVLFGCDVDPDALAVAQERLAPYLRQNSVHGPWFIPVQSNFADLTPELLEEHAKLAVSSTGVSALEEAVVNDNGLRVDGILLDLGVSSYQIDTAERGFAFMKDGPLDMRMNGQTSGGATTASHPLTAANLCNELDMSELRRIFKLYGDEPRARAIAESIVERRPLSTTAALQAAVAAVTPPFHKNRRLGRTATLARVFQSLRIVVNNEDVVLERALTQMAPNLLLSPGGRLVVLSYHSMEDRAVKRVMRDGTVSKREALYNEQQRDMYGNYIGTPKPFGNVGKPVKATEAEVALNARARSATLRVAERL